MEQKTNHHNGFGNGFVLGLLVGIVATLLLTTKKGREIFREITEKGLDRFSDLEDKLQETKSQMMQSKDEYDELDEEEGDDYIPEEPLPVEETKEKHTNGHATHHASHEHHEHHEEHHKPSGSRRFFRTKKN